MKMKRYTYYIIGALFGAMLSGLVACQEDALEQLPQGGIEEGMVSFQLRAVSGEQILTKGNENDESLYDLDEPIHNVYLMLFDTQGKKINTAYQHLVDNNTVVNLYLPKDANRVYAFCNLQDTTILKNIATEDDLNTCDVVIDKPQDAYTGSFVLSGSVDLEKSGDNFHPEYIIETTRLAARLIFKIGTELPEGDEFKIGSVYMHYIPKGSRLLEQPAADTLKAAEQDYTYAPTAGDRINKYFSANGTHDSLWIDLKPKGNIYTATVHLFENRQGGAEEKLDANGNPTDKENSYWKAIASLSDDEYLYYRQIFKKRLADSLDIDYASYLTINGFYTTAGKAARKVTYYVYVGKDNYKDFNIRRNHSYLHKITIKAKDMLDSRVITSGTGRIEVESQLGGNHVLDAHCNVSEALIFAETGWTVRVADPDRTPWLEVSKSPVYRPRIVGESGEDRASFKVSGSAGLDYFYVHTDEYVPEIKKPSDNNSMIDPDKQGFSNIRKGKLICESANGGYKEIEVRQYAAQMVVLDAKYLLGPDGLVWKEVRDTFYVERCLEERNLEWGFNQYWCHTLNVMIGWGNWDGLWNTRNLYRVALQGDDLGNPAYPISKGGIPADIALGYAINKNRDRNGNGMIDYDEIMWYLPALNELNALCSSIHNKNNTDWVDTDDRGFVWLDEENTTYHSSTPSVADPGGVTPGRNYYVDFLSEKQGICLRTRRCNVICMRRKGAWRGPTTGEADGNIDIDTGWAGDDEMVMPKETK